jgi:serine/threonine protein kinase
MIQPSVPSDPSVESLVGQVADEFTQRLNNGERPTVEEYAQQYPKIADLLRGVLPALGLLHRSDVEEALSDDDPNLTEPLGDFRLIREIGRGGMGIVYEAWQLSLNRRVAVKVLPFAAALDPRRLQRFKKEALAAASLHHEHIVPVYFVGCERGVHFYAMQFIDGLSLAAVIAEMRQLAGRDPADPQRTAPHAPPGGSPTAAGVDTSPLAALTTEGSTRSPGYFDSVARLGLEAAKGLEHAHQEIVWHRDIKPANLLIDTHGKLWITDFGLAQMRSDSNLTQSGELVGTLRYMSPEQAMANRIPVDHRTDIYSLGATLYELLTLEPVFRGGDRQELLRQIAFDDPTPPRKLNRHVPLDLETIVLTALAKAPAHRYATAKEMAEDLQRFLNDQPIKKRPENLHRWLWRKSRRYASGIAVSLAAVITAVVLSLYLLHLNQPSPEEEARLRQEKALVALTHDLDQNRKVTLIGKRGPPGYYRWPCDDNPGKILSDQESEFTVQNLGHGLLELLPDPRMHCYRFSAEVRHERQAHQESRVGIYFAYSQHPIGEAVAHFHCNINFNDLVDVGKPDANGNYWGNPVGLQAHRQALAGLVGAKVFFTQWDKYFIPAKPVQASGPWHRIAVEVRPVHIQVSWDGKPFAPIPYAILMKEARPLFARPNQPLPENHPKFAPRDGLGLYVSLGVASFRNVVVEPLGDAN